VTRRSTIGRMLSACIVAIVCLSAACQDGVRWGRTSATVDGEALALLLPAKIKLHNFTKIKPLFGGTIPNGIDVWLEPLDRFDDTIKIVGELRFELYTFKPASGDHMGEQMEFWQVRIATAAEQQQHWDRVARMYHFPLAWDYAPPPGKRYVLLATYQGPNGQRLTDTHDLQFELDRDRLKESKSLSDK